MVAFTSVATTQGFKHYSNLLTQLPTYPLQFPPHGVRYLELVLLVRLLSLPSRLPLAPSIFLPFPFLAPTNQANCVISRVIITPHAALVEVIKRPMNSTFWQSINIVTYWLGIDLLLSGKWRGEMLGTRLSNRYQSINWCWLVFIGRLPLSSLA